MFASHIALLKTLSLLGVILVHAMLPFTRPEGFWKFYAEQPSEVAEFFKFWGGFIIIPSFMLASGYLAALSEEKKLRRVHEYIAARIKRLLVPWFLLMVFWTVPLYTLFDIPSYNRPAGYTLAQTYQAALTGLFADHLWFLLVLFWVGLFFALIRPLEQRFGGLTGPALALVAALLMNVYGRELTWYAVWQTDGPLVWFGLGIALGRYRAGIGEAIARYPWALFCANAALFVVAAKYAAQTVPWVYWTTCGLGALGAFQACLHLARCHAVFRRFRLYRYFEDNAFRFYLFHMPGAYLCFKMLAAAGLTSPLPYMLSSFALNFCLTAGIVALVNALEKRWE
jgi:surface polysaccharide O-acyltransferase-like enzyme